jgi:Fe-S-cluster containining protein
MGEEKGIELGGVMGEDWDMKLGKRSGKKRVEADREVLAAVEGVYAELEVRLGKVARDCRVVTRCCRFQLTGEVPVLTLGEALVAARGVRASGRRELKPHAEGACPLLGREGRCTIYTDRPFGCRTHFCRAAGGVVPRKLVGDLIQRLEALDEKLGGDGSRGLPEAIAAVL